ncbi:hypothetical protein F4801DRAFT_531705 [Xylaria longipes]|nr:hypothetical protein F4801DRAFT_531705 [Xylaria longipes]RYC58195.1 hypothetical protein CHU98_g8011 [Xylaria longipes]
MPPKRKHQVTVSSDSESDMVSLRRPKETAILPTIMRNIEMLKVKREDNRKGITAKFDAYISKKKKEIEDHYASEAKKKSAELKDLLTRYAHALEQRASIEKSIEDIVLNTRQGLNELSVVLEAAYSGRQQQTHAAAGSFSSIAPVPAKSTVSANPTNPLATTTNIRNRAQADKGEKEGGGRNGDLAYAGKENVFDQILW